MSSPLEQPSTPSFALNFSSGESATLTPLNTALYTFYGDAAMYDHVYIVLPKDSPGGDVELVPVETDSDDEQDLLTASYIFRNEPAFEDLVRLIVEYDYPQILFSRNVPEQDKDIYWAKQLQGFGDTGLGIEES